MRISLIIGPVRLNAFRIQYPAIMRHELLILYRHSMAAADELRWCLRSLRNVSGCNPVPIVVGDPPDWYTGPVLAAGQNMRSKFDVIVSSQVVADRFCCLADDNAILKPITFDDLMIPRVQPCLTKEPESGGWLKQRWKIALSMTQAGLPCVDAETHWPRCWEKPKLAQLLADVAGESLVWKTLYLARFGGPTKDAGMDMRNLRRGADGFCEDAICVSYKNEGFLGGIRNLLVEQFPEP